MPTFICCIDGKENSHAALHTLLQMLGGTKAARANADTIILAAFYKGEEDPKLAQDLEELKQFILSGEKDVKLQVEISANKLEDVKPHAVAKAICHLAEISHAEHLFLGSRSSVGHLLGSVSELVMKDAPCSVTIARHGSILKTKVSVPEKH